MIEKPQVYLSNSTEILTQSLRSNLFFSKSDPFRSHFIFLPRPNLKNTLLKHFVADGKLDVVLGLKFLELGSGLQILYHWTTGKTLLFPPLDLLVLHLESLLENPGLALSLAKEFVRYGKFGGSFLKKWNDPLQRKLWDTLFEKWNYPYQLLESPLKKPNQTAEIHLFNFPFLPKLYHLFFSKLSKFFPVHYYQFSPCQEFWSDSVTEYEKMRLLKKDPQLSLYLEDGNPLLKNFGKMGRETFRVFEEEDFIFHECYEARSPKSYLSSIQNDILNYQKTKTDRDESILLLPSHSKLREVEILYAEFLELSCNPSDIQIFAPDIAPYAPFIQTVFGKEESPFDFTIRDLPDHSIFQTFYDFLSLNDKRFDVPSLFKLFSSPYFIILNKKEVKEFRSWIDKSGVKWGVDGKHRKFLLPNILDVSENGTWQQAFDHLLNNLLFIPEKPTDWDLPYPDFSESELLGKCISLIQSLRRDLEYLQTAILSAAKWGEHLLILFDRYLASEEEEHTPLQEKLLLLKEIDATYTFSSIKRYLANGLKENRGTYHANQLESLTFQSLKPGAVLSSKVIALLGMHEGVFPRPHIHSSLNLLGGEGDYYPKAPDEDRYLFLETLIAAKEKIFITYQNIGEEDGKERPPSLFVQELDPLVKIHPPFPFHHSYFEERDRVYSKSHYKTACNFYSSQKQPPFIPEFLHPTPLTQSSNSLVEPTPEDLRRFAKNPLKFYCNQVLNLYLHYDMDVDEEFLSSPLQKHKLLSRETSFQEADFRGHLPLGRFKEVALQNIAVQQKEIASHTVDEGFLFMGEGKFHELIKIYPLYLLACLENPQPLVAQKNGAAFSLKSDPKKAYEDYLIYYQIALETPSPLEPQFANALLNKDAKAFASRIKNALPDPYLRLIFSRADHYDPEAIFNTWAPFLREVFAPLLEMIE